MGKTSTPGRRPNILFIFTDQQSLRAMSCAGNPYLVTPNIDRLAASGVRFTNSYCASPVCGPSRAALVTGRVPSAVGVPVNGMVPDPAIPTIGELLREAGYDTAWTGNWHLPDTYPTTPEVRGFEYLPTTAGPHPLGDVTDVPTAEAAIEYLRRPHCRPFMLGVSLKNPHDICYEIGRITERADLPPLDTLPPLPTNFAIDPAEPEFIQWCRQRTYYGGEGYRTRNWSEHQWQTYLYTYYRLVERVDAVVGSILSALREAGLEDDSVVIFSSDHGEGMAAHHWVVKLMLWEEAVQVPFIISWPGVLPAGQVDGRLVSGLDLVPTLCELSQVSVPPQLPGLSLVPLLNDVSLAGHDYVVTEVIPDTKDLSRRGWMLRSARFKYVGFSHGNNSERLFDVSADPGETINLVDHPGCRAELVRHRTLLQEWLERYTSGSDRQRSSTLPGRGD